MTVFLLVQGLPGLHVLQLLEVKCLDVAFINTEATMKAYLSQLNTL